MWKVPSALVFTLAPCMLLTLDIVSSFFRITSADSALKSSKYAYSALIPIIWFVCFGRLTVVHSLVDRDDVVMEILSPFV